MSDNKPIDPAAKDAAPNTTAAGTDRELTDADLSQVSGGYGQDATLNKAKTADKAFKVMDDYIRG